MAIRELTEVLDRIRAAAERSGRSADEVTLIAVTKARTVPEILAAYDAGHRDFGENRAGELAEKAPHLPGDIRWHFIGHLQRNKVTRVRPLVSMLHSLDRAKLARTWGHLDDAPPALLEINIGREPQKHGVLPEDARGLLDSSLEAGVDVRGVMAIPPMTEDAAVTRGHFRALAELAESLSTSGVDLPELSMGMTDDYEIAVEEGATMVRVGRAIFGPRPG